MTTLDQFISTYLGRRIDTDGVPKDQPYQCVDLGKQYVHEVYGEPLGSYGDAIRWWTATSPSVTRHFTTATQPQRGGLVVLQGGLFDATSGHLGIVLAFTATTLTIAQQNAPTIGAAVNIATIPRTNVVGYLNPITVTTQPAGEEIDMTPEQAKQLALVAADVAEVKSQTRWLMNRVGGTVKLASLTNLYRALRDQVAQLSKKIGA